MIDVVLNQCFLGLADGLFDSVQLLSDVDTGSAGLDHLDDLLQMAIRPLQAKSYFSMVGMLLINVHQAFISPQGGYGQVRGSGYPTRWSGERISKYNAATCVIISRGT